MGGQDIDNKLIEQMYQLWRIDNPNADEPWEGKSNSSNKVKAYFKN